MFSQAPSRRGVVMSQVLNVSSLLWIAREGLELGAEAFDRAGHVLDRAGEVRRLHGSASGRFLDVVDGDRERLALGDHVGDDVDDVGHRGLEALEHEATELDPDAQEHAAFEEVAQAALDALGHRCAGAVAGLRTLLGRRRLEVARVEEHRHEDVADLMPGIAQPSRSRHWRPRRSLGTHSRTAVTFKSSRAVSSLQAETSAPGLGPRCL